MAIDKAKIVVRTVQGAYITKDAKETLKREAKRQGVFITRLASEILEREARVIARWEGKYVQNSQTETA